MTKVCHMTSAHDEEDGRFFIRNVHLLLNLVMKHF